MALESSQRLPELLFYTKKSHRILQLQFQLQFYTCTLHHNPENSPSRIQFYMQKTKSSLSTTTTFQRAKRPSFQKRNSTHRRQGDLLEIHPCVLQDIPGTPAASPYKGNSSYSRDIPVFQTFQAFQSFQSFQAFQSFQSFQTLQRHSRHSSHSWPSSLPGNSTNSTMFQYLQGIHPIPAFSD